MLFIQKQIREALTLHFDRSDEEISRELSPESFDMLTGRKVCICEAAGGRADDSAGTDFAIRRF